MVRFCVEISEAQIAKVMEKAWKIYYFCCRKRKKHNCWVMEELIKVGNYYWKKVPNRDEVLEKVYAFMKALAHQNPEEASQCVIVHSMHHFQTELHRMLLSCAGEVLSENDKQSLGPDLSLAITDPELVNEDQSQPDFSSNNFYLREKEVISVKVALKKKVTPVTLNFSINKADEVYFLKLEEPSAHYYF